MFYYSSNEAQYNIKLEFFVKADLTSSINKMCPLWKYPRPTKLIKNTDQAIQTL